MNKYYLSLVRSLIGYCLKFNAPDKIAVRKWAYMHMPKMWCSVYDTPERMQVIGQTTIINANGDEEED